jgi:hypothetical protein
LSAPPGKKSLDLERWVGAWALTSGARKTGDVARRKVDGGVNWVEDVLGGEAPTGRRRAPPLGERGMEREEPDCSSGARGPAHFL